MSAALGAALKKIAAALLSDPETLKKAAMVILVLLVAAVMPILAVVAVFQNIGSSVAALDQDALAQRVLTAVPAEELASLQRSQASINAVTQALQERGLGSQTDRAFLLCLLYLPPELVQQDDFPPRLASCFTAGQTDRQLISAVNLALGTRIDPDGFTAAIDSFRAVAIDASQFAAPEVKNNFDLVQWAVTAQRGRWGYVTGTFGQVLTEGLLRSKLGQYPESVAPYEEFIRAHWLGRRTADCIGLIKSYCWYDPGTEKITYQSNGMPDVDTDMLFRVAAEKGGIDTIPEIPGLAVWRPGHIGIYIGGGRVIEAAGTELGVIQSELAARDFTHWLKIPYIAYWDAPPEAAETTVPGTTTAP